MFLNEAFSFCPNCQHRLTKKEDCHQCSQCQVSYYHNPSPTCAGILVNQNNEILLTKRRFPPKKDWWDLPGGFVQPKETGEQGLIREIKEELNITVNQPKYFGSYWSIYPYKNISYYVICLVYLAKIDSHQESIKLADDVIGFRFFKPAEIKLDEIAFRDVKQALEDYLAQLKP